MGKESSPPQAPDYSAAAKDTAAGNLEMAKYTTRANRINQYTPYGSLTYTQKQPSFDQTGYDKAMAAYQRAPSTVADGSGYDTLSWETGEPVRRFVPGQQATSAPRREDFMGADDGGGWEQRMELTPQAQATLDKNMALSDKYADVAGIGFDRARQIFENPQIDESLLPQRAIDIGKTAQEALLSRLNPTLASDEEALRTRLSNQGIGLGSTAYNREMALQGQRGTDLRLQAALQGINLDQANRASALNEAYTAQSRPLDLVNALRTGAQVQNPQFNNFAQQANVAGPDLLAATNQQYGQQMSGYNADQAANAGMMGGLGNLALTGAKMAGMFSDRRMKENIVKIGSLDNGLNLYKFDYKPEFKDIAGHNTYIGVMADEAKAIPNAVIRQSNGYDMVDYSKVY
jgi:hypothetical protein